MATNTIHCPHCKVKLHPPRCCCRYRHEEWVVCANCEQQFRLSFGGDRAPSVAMRWQTKIHPARDPAHNAKLTGTGQQT
jgi:hypothetical protein